MYLSCLFYFSLRKCDITSRKYALKQGNRIGVRFIKHDIQVSQNPVYTLYTRVYFKNVLKFYLGGCGTT
jgi:hypothetical protein